MFKNIFKRNLPVITPEMTTPQRDERFEAWPKTKRLFRTIIVTEKIDGTNGCIVFEDDGTMFVQSRNRIITPANDNQGFAAWAYRNEDELFHILGTGRHYGEWWGKSIGRNYGMDHRVFSVFNSTGWYKQGMDYRAGHSTIKDEISVIPTLYHGTFEEQAIRDAAELLFVGGSVAVQEYGKTFAVPEGVCVYFREIDTVMKYTFDKNDSHKWEAE